MYALFQSLANSAYITGETRLDAIIKELRCLEQDSKHFSNTDGIFKNNKPLRLVF